jgi:hypothetical protein
VKRGRCSKRDGVGSSASDLAAIGTGHLKIADGSPATLQIARATRMIRLPSGLDEHRCSRRDPRFELPLRFATTSDYMRVRIEKPNE